MKKLCILTSILVLLCVSCGIKTNLDIQEAIFPPEHSIIVYQNATSQGFKNGSTLSLVGIGDAGHSSWEELHIENLTEHEIEFDGLPKISNTDIFEIRDPLFKFKLGPYERTGFEVRYKLADVGSVETDLAINYKVNKRKRNFSIKLSGNFIGLQIVEVIAANPPLIPSEIERNLPNGGAGVDFGYKEGDQVTRKFRIKNNSNERIVIQNISLDAAADSAGFNFDGHTELPAGTISANSSRDFELTFPESSMLTYKKGNIIIRHDRSPHPYKVAVCGGGPIMPIEIVHRRSGEDVSCVVPYKLDKNCYDFGYKPAVSEFQSIGIKNMSKAILRFENIDVNLVSGAFTLQKKYQPNELVYPGDQAKLEIRFTPQPNTWSEDDIIIKDNNTGRKYVLSLTGSGFKQPKDIPGLSLWLRADRIGKEHLTDSKAEIFPDISGHDFDAIKYKGKGPTYKENGIGLWPDSEKLPVLNFSDNEAMAVLTSEDKWITENAEGTTSFVIFRPKLNEKRYHTQVAIVGSNGTKPIFPYIGTTQFVFDPVDGLTKNGLGDPRRSVRFYIENGYLSGGRSPASSMIYNIDNDPNPLYAAAIRFDNSKNDPDPNFHFFVNGDKDNTGETPIAYVHSSDQGATSGNIRAYGYPVGHRGEIRDYALDPHPAGACPMDYALHFLNTNHPFFKSRTSSGSSLNGSIKNLYIGKHADESSPFYGDIAEVIIFNRALTDDEIKEVYNYIKVRYNTQRLPEAFYKLYKIHPAVIPWIQKTY